MVDMVIETHEECDVCDPCYTEDFGCFQVLKQLFVIFEEISCSKSYSKFFHFDSKNMCHNHLCKLIFIDPII